MGLLKSIFKGNQNTQTKPLHKVDGTIQDLVLLCIAEDFMVGENKYPDYLQSRFGIDSPKKQLQNLEKRGYIRPSTSIESLSHLKAAELKSIASMFELKTSGKKEDLCNRIAENVTEEVLKGIIKKKYWIITENGKALLDENKHIGFYMEKHPYSLEAAGLDIASYAKLFSGKHNGRIRDVVWGELNKKSIEYYSAAMSTGKFFDYCEVLHTMAMFLEEENRHRDALAAYMRYIHYRSNFEAGLPAIKNYSLLGKVNDAADRLFLYAEILPFIADEIQTISNGCGFDTDQLRTFMRDAFSRENDTGVFSPDELTEFVMCGLKKDQAGQKRICKTVMKSAAMKLPKKKS